MENSEKRGFFELLNPKSALIVGLVTGFLVICTIGFIVLGVMALTRGINSPAGKTGSTSIVDDAAAASTGPVAEVPKSDKPKVELFVMSYCPYGLQMEKAYLPVMELLKDKAELDVKFVSYAMHEKKEIDENTRQYCIQKDQASKYIAYLKCFTGKDDYKACLKEAGVSESKVNSCVTKADKEFGITAKYNDQSSWLSGRFPIYPVHAAENEQYGVQGSPTLVINGIHLVSSEEELAQCESQGVKCTMSSLNRTPEAVKQAVCGAFNNPPAECGQTLSTQSPGAGFGTSAGAATDASCG